MSIMSYWSNVSFKAYISLLIFCWNDPSGVVEGIFKFSTTTVFFSVLFFSVVGSHSVCAGALWLGAHVLRSVMSS